MNPFKMFSGDQSKSLPTVEEVQANLKAQHNSIMQHYTDAIMNNPVVTPTGGSYVASPLEAQRRINHNTFQQASFNDPYSVSVNSDLWRMRMLNMRLRLAEGSTLPFQHISTGLGGDHVFVFLVHNGEPVTLKDDAAMFPSDTLITQLRLLIP